MGRDTQSKVKTLAEVAAAVEKLRAKGKVIVQCHGVFDMLHPGHIRHFEAARTKGDVLVVTITRDEFVNKGPGRPIFNHELRAESVASLECVDFVAVSETPTAVEAIRAIKPDFYVKGSDYRSAEEDLTGKIHDEEQAVAAVGGHIHFTDEITFSSSSLINRHLAPFPKETREFLDRVKGHHGSDDVIDALKSLRGLKVLVVGDTIIDEYHYCLPMGKSAKDSIIATRFVSEERFAGGVLAAVNHLAGFCDDVTLLTGIGTQNDYRDFVESSLRPSIERVIFEQEGVPTVVKRRFVVPTFITKLFEIVYLDESGFLSSPVERKALRWLDQNLDRYDLVLVADFGHGLVTPKIVRLLARKARFLALNVQSNSANLGFNLVTKYPRADYVCIDEPELRLASHDRFSNLERLITSTAKKLKCDHVMITRGEKGCLYYSADEGFTAAPVLSSEVLDRIGAGDAFSAVTAPCVLKGMPGDMVGLVGNAVGAMQVLTVGNRQAVDPTQLYKYIVTLMK